MWNNKLKAITFSFDDGVKQDKKLIKLLDKYNLKATFNINSGLLGKKDIIYFDKKHKCNHIKNKKEEIKKIYKNHEVACHTLTHPNLTILKKEEIIKQINNDQKNLTKLTNKDVIGLAYPCAYPNCNKKVINIIKKNTTIKYARTIKSSYNFDIPEDLIEYNPTVYYLEVDKMFELGKKFIKLKPNKPQLFYIWGHSYELDSPMINYKILEEFFKLISNKKDIYYCTNKDAFDL